MRSHGQCLDHVFVGEVGGMICKAAAHSPRLAMVRDAELFRLVSEFYAKDELSKICEPEDEESAYDAVREVADRIWATRAAGPEGMRVKVRLAQESFYDFVEDQLDIMASLAADLDAMMGSGNV